MNVTCSGVPVSQPLSPFSFYSLNRQRQSECTSPSSTIQASYLKHTMSAAPVESQQYQGGAPAAGLNGHSGAAPIDTSVPAHAADGTSAGPLSAGGASTISNGLNPKEAKSMHKVLEKEEKREDKNIKSTVKEVAKVHTVHLPC